MPAAASSSPPTPQPASPSSGDPALLISPRQPLVSSSARNRATSCIARTARLRCYTPGLSSLPAGDVPLAGPGRLPCRRCARRLGGGRDDRCRGMRSSRRRPGSAETGGGISQDRASTRSSLRGRAGLSERPLAPMGAAGGAGCAIGDEQGPRWLRSRPCVRAGAGLRRGVRVAPCGNTLHAARAGLVG